MAATIGQESTYKVDHFIYDPAFAGNDFDSWIADVPVGSFVMNVETGTLYVKLANARGTITIFPLTGINDNDYIDANYTPKEEDNIKGIQLSDDRLKDYKGDLNITLANINKIPLRYFTYKNNDEMNIGTSAQEMLEICPEVVKTNKDGFMMVDYSKLSLLALRGIRLQQNKIKSLEKKLSDLDERLKKLENNQ